ncbi:MAG: DUF1573 domain-containing protein [Flavobacteriales bacterium]
MRHLVVVAIFTLAVSCLNKTDKEKSSNLTASNESVPLAPAPAKAVVDESKLTSIQWLDSSKSMGTVTEGGILKINYRFRNSGSKPLVIEKVQPGCGCTVADYPKEPIAPGKEGEITAEFDTKGREGMQKKNITVFANTRENTYTLYFDVTINKAKS